MAAFAGSVAADAGAARRSSKRSAAACFEFHQALETLYLRSVAGKNLLRNKPLRRAVGRGLSRSRKTAGARSRTRAIRRTAGRFRRCCGLTCLLTDEGFVLTELDSVPGGIGLTAFLNRLYSGEVQPTRSRLERRCGARGGRRDGARISMRRSRRCGPSSGIR